MNITNKFQHTPIQGQPQSNLQAQQILLLQLHQGQAQQQQQPATATAIISWGTWVRLPT